LATLLHVAFSQFSILSLLPFRLFFFHDPAPTETYTLSLHDALPISIGVPANGAVSNVTFSPAAVSKVAREVRLGGYDVVHVHERSEEHTSELQSRSDLVCRLLLEKKKKSE